MTAAKLAAVSLAVAWWLAGPAVLVAAGIAITAAVVAWRWARRSPGDPTAPGTQERGAAFASSVAEVAPLVLRRPAPGRFLLGRFGRFAWWSTTLATPPLRDQPAGQSPTDRVRARRAARRQADGTGHVAVIGPSRCGKTEHVKTAVRALSEGGCSLILSSVKDDLIDLVAQRRLVGRVGVYDPSGELFRALDARHAAGTAPAGWDPRLRVGWSPLAGVASFDDATAVAARLVDGIATDTVTNGDFWRDQAARLLGALVWIAALTEGASMGHVAEWATAPPQPIGPDGAAPSPLRELEALGTSGDAEVAADAARVARLLAGLWQGTADGHGQTAASIYKTAQTAVTAWTTRAGAASATGTLVDTAWLVGGENTLVLSAPPDEHQRLAPALSGCVADLLDGLFRHCATHGPLTTPLVVVLDEIGNAPLAKLPQYLATMAGFNVRIVTIWQDRAQMEAAYGHRAGSILQNSTVMVYPGTLDLDTLDWVQRVLAHTAPSAGTGPAPLMPANELRELRRGQAVVIGGNRRPAKVWHLPEHSVNAFASFRAWPYGPAETVGLPGPDGATRPTTGPAHVTGRELAAVFGAPPRAALDRARLALAQLRRSTAHRPPALVVDQGPTTGSGALPHTYHQPTH